MHLINHFRFIYISVNSEYGPTIKSQKVKIIEEECIGCKKCISACPVDAI
ncbi:4Fe-4S binding protein, partial [bacterium]|nr:4Fe-4S binding protein [bacterium]